FIDAEKNVNTVEEALEGARHILMEVFAENADLLGEFRQYLWEHIILKSSVIKDKENDGKKFADYFTYEEPINKIPSHRALALLRGQREEILRLDLVLDEEQTAYCQQKICAQFGIANNNRPADV